MIEFDLAITVNRHLSGFISLTTKSKVVDFTTFVHFTCVCVYLCVFLYIVCPGIGLLGVGETMHMLVYLQTLVLFHYSVGYLMC